ncbi:LLM class flavin-dependent oxidoreductase [Actinomadura rifamycini]|uniref:LLM class flavin-dependent oxidoreductase n=1 Tax=Actinomadura rifamycini TaxID=31962 RepID=UPI0003FC322C|nr:LLM class flavin-dependent oxidoreductase [Actinomadura rifamycini]
MNDTGRRMHLAVFARGLGAAHSVWRSPRTEPEKVHTLEHWTRVAQVAEQGKFDAVFVAEALNLSTSIGTDATEWPDAVSLVAALSAVTSRIGLVATSSTTYSHPFTVARQFATIDHLSGGRVGWNIVTTAIAAAAGNYGSADLPEHESRYERADEFVDIVTRLWDGWRDDAIVLDRDAGVYADLDRIRRLDHEGAHFTVRGPLTMPRSPQGRPALVQAGSSPTGMNLAARYADMVFTTQFDIGDSKAFVDRMRELVAANGRDPRAVAVMPGLTPIIGRTVREARDLARELGGFVHTDATLAFMQQMFGGIDFTAYDLDEPFPDVAGLLPPHAGVSRPRLFMDMAKEEGLTLRQVAQRIGLSTGHRSIVGTPDQVADEMAAWFTAGAADGFNLLPADLPRGLEDFVEEVVPRLQDRGLFREDYTGTTLREHLGAPAPEPAPGGAPTLKEAR